MAQLNFHSQNNYSSKPPPSHFSLSIIQKLTQVYKLWHGYLPDFPKDSRYTLGAKVDSLFLGVIEEIIKASSSDKTEKLIFLKTASVKLDLLKFFLQITWEIESLDNKKYIRLSEKLGEIGKMLGGWIKSLK
ncbi:four helix bundle protein [Patescibacteria group bacterium]|nr:four helix bundle protein [Patescibacteria group bacterium]